ncbi:MAG: hypothetical protein ACI4AD_03265 [Roseburia sp.]
MRNLVRKLDGVLIGAQIRLKNAMRNVLESEQGDTNFVSIGIVLVVVLLLATAFVTFGKSFKAKLADVFAKLLNLFK